MEGLEFKMSWVGECGVRGQGWDLQPRQPRGTCPCGGTARPCAPGLTPGPGEELRHTRRPASDTFITSGGAGPRERKRAKRSNTASPHLALPESGSANPKFAPPEILPYLLCVGGGQNIKINFRGGANFGRGYFHSGRARPCMHSHRAWTHACSHLSGEKAKFI